MQPPARNAETLKLNTEGKMDSDRMDKALVDKVAKDPAALD
eukprot:CAMPEP_0175875104 /NCGR_PEP_ID=MMETSP0107_2-20121207/39271_1 /TAXON_ID=195067 ORGANISM="Goniomonas pacifica, Strain CCMP1869" /NCGR_SAMPLE_ID=MMETSP0107_2 /ASSEMBLY_ACC=CAM_ASM_000203 /LENGTH=40 /DNA_ID= /DNA_START= /DNA_END= /DNA_ORIENTATION=